MKKIPSLIVSFFLILNASSALYGQDYLFESGSIIRTTDTLIGYLKRGTDFSLTSVIEFKKESKNADIQEFTPNDIISFTFDSDKNLYASVQIRHFKSDKLTTEKRFGRLILKGTTNLYKVPLDGMEKKSYFEKNASDLYVVLKKDTFYTLEVREDLVFNNEGNAYNLKKNYVSILKYLTRDCPKINAKAESVAFNEKDLVAYIEAYNNCLNPLEKTVISKPVFKRIIEHGAEGFVDIKANTLIGIGYFMDVKEPNFSNRAHAIIGLSGVHFSSLGSQLLGTKLKVIGNYDLLLTKTQRFYFGIGYEYLFLSKDALSEFLGLSNINIGYRYWKLRLELSYQTFGFPFLSQENNGFINFTLGWYLKSQ